MDKKIEELTFIVSKIYQKKICEYKNISSISGKYISYFENKLNSIESKLSSFMNYDYYDAGLNYIQLVKNSTNNLISSDKKIKIYNDLNKYLKFKGIEKTLIIFVEDEEGYYLSINIKGYCEFYLSGLLKYYIVKIEKKDRDIGNYIESFLNERGYKELTKELGETELDIEGETFHSLKRHNEIQRDYYNLYFGDKDDFYFDGKDGREKVNTKKEDLEKFLILDYERPFRVKHLLFGESFIGKLEE